MAFWSRPGQRLELDVSDTSPGFAWSRRARPRWKPSLDVSSWATFFRRLRGVSPLLTLQARAFSVLVCLQLTSPPSTQQSSWLLANVAGPQLTS